MTPPDIMECRAVDHSVYVEGKDLGLTFGGVKGGDIHISAYIDADHAACTDSQRSLSGGAVMLAYPVISYISRTQTIGLWRRQSQSTLF